VGGPFPGLDKEFLLVFCRTGEGTVQQLLILIAGIKTILFNNGYFGERNLRLEG
jgi:hypothetical protein